MQIDDSTQGPGNISWKGRKILDKLLGLQHMTERLPDINPQIRPDPDVTDSNEIFSVTLLNLSAPPPQQVTELFELRVAQVKFDPRERSE